MKTFAILSLVIIILSGCENEKQPSSEKQPFTRADTTAVSVRPSIPVLSIKQGFLGMRWGEKISYSTLLGIMKARHASPDYSDTENESDVFLGGDFLSMPVTEWLFRFTGNPSEGRFGYATVYFANSPAVPLQQPFRALRHKLTSLMGKPELNRLSFENSHDGGPATSAESNREFELNKAVAIAEWHLSNGDDSLRVLLRIDDNPIIFLAISPMSFLRSDMDSLTHQDSLDFIP